MQWSKKSARRAELNNSALEKFCQTFGAYTEPSNRKFFRMNKVPLDFWADSDNKYDEIAGYQSRAETVEGVAIHIPIYKLDDFLNVVDEQRYKELYIRDNVPAVKLAYEQYRILLKMCGDYDAGY